MAGAGGARAAQDAERHTGGHASGPRGPRFSKKRRLTEILLFQASAQLQSGERVAVGAGRGQSYVRHLQPWYAPPAATPQVPGRARVARVPRRSGRGLTGGRAVSDSEVKRAEGLIV